MTDQQAASRAEPATDDPWQGIDFSGTALVLGVGTGRLIQMLVEQASRAAGQLLVTSFQRQSLDALVPLRQNGPITLIQSRPRQIPLVDESVDFLLANGVLRQVPAHLYGAMVEEIWRVLVPGAHLRISDIVEPSEAPYNQSWSVRNAVVRKLAKALARPTALSVDLKGLALALRTTGFEELSASLLPGYGLADAWLQETVESVRTMAAQVADKTLRDAILGADLSLLIDSYRTGGQRAAERVVLKGRKPGDLALEMRASFTEQDLMPTD